MEEKYRRLRLATDAKLNGDNPVKIMAIELVGSAAGGLIEITEDGNGAGTNVYELSVPANTSAFRDFSELGGISLSAGFGDLTGEGAVAYIWWE